MNVTLSLVLIVIGVVLFILDGLKVQTPVNLVSLGWAAIVLGALVVS